MLHTVMSAEADSRSPGDLSLIVCLSMYAEFRLRPTESVFSLLALRRSTCFLTSHSTLSLLCHLSRKRVRDAVKAVDPDGVRERSKRGLVRRKYRSCVSVARSCMRVLSFTASFYVRAPIGYGTWMGMTSLNILDFPFGWSLMVRFEFIVCITP